MNEWMNEKAVGERRGYVASRERSEGGGKFAQLDSVALMQVSGSL